jgi:WD40 repeat protein
MVLEQATAVAMQAEDIALLEEPADYLVTLPPPHPLILSPLLDWDEMPAVDFFTGREVEVAQLMAWLAPQAHAGSAPAQFVLILGMGGIGKTTLAAAVTKAVAPIFAAVIWRSLLNAPPLSELLRSWLQTLSRQTLTSPPESLDEQLRLLAAYLRQERCLLVLDNVESIFAASAPVPEGTPHPQGRAGVMRPGYEGYDQLLQWLANSDHQSCLLLTSREQPYSFVRPGRQAQETTGRIRVLPMAGLDRQAGNALLQSNGLYTSAEEAAQLIETYSGNPLALQIVAGAIADFFGGDVAAFQRAEGSLFDGMRLVLDQQFARLSPLERDILVWLTIEREAIPVQTLRSNLLQPVSMRDLLEALQALQNRSLLEKRDSGLTLQNVIIEYTTEYLVEQVCQEIEESAERGVQTIPHAALNRFALLKAEAKEYVRQSQVRLIVQPVAARLVAQLGKAQVAACIPGLLDALRAAEVRTGYAGGNLLNLLIELGEDLAGYDFSLLPVWQADLRRVRFAAINFAGADLTHSSFILAFDLRAIKFAPSRQPSLGAARQVLIAGTVEGDVCLWQAADGQLGHAFRRPSNSIYPVVFSPDGQQIATSGRDFAVHVWSAESGQPLCTLVGHTDKIYMLAFSADGQYLASSSNDSTVRIWHLPSRRLLHTLVDYVDAFMTPTFSTDGAVLAAGGGQPIFLWDVASGQLIRTLRGHVREIECLAFSPDDRLLVSGGHDGSIRVWDARSGEHLRTLQAHSQIVRALAFAPGCGDGYLLASGGADRSVRLWDVGSGQVLHTLLGHQYEVGSLSFGGPPGSDGQALASGSIDRTVHVWDTQTGRLLDVISGHATTVRAVAFSPAGDRLASGGADSIVRLWSVHSPKPAPEPNKVVHHLQGHAEQVYAVSFSPDGRFLASAGGDRLIYLWDVATGRCVQILRGHQGIIKAVAFSPDGGSLASGSADCTIRIWSAATGQNRCILEGHEAEVTTLAFHPAGGRLLSGSADHSARIWDIDRGEARFILKKHTSALYRVVFHPAGEILATNSWDSTLHLWEASTGAHRPAVPGRAVRMFGIAFHPAGSLFAGVTPEQAIELRAYPSGEVLHTLRGHTTAVLSLDFHPTQPLLASSSWNGAIRLWDTQTGDLLNTLSAPGPYAGMNITGVTGISEAQKAALRALGAYE